MSTVLWVNSLLNGQVETDDGDKYALYKHTDKLDKICKSIGLPPFSDLCDSTDLRYNMDDDMELPEGMESTNDIMALEGVWLEASEAVQRLEKLLAEIKAKNIKFGMMKNDHEDVVAELEESIDFANTASANQAKFNFCIVM